MSDRIRDRTLVLRVLVPSLEVRLRDKMKEAEDLAASGVTSITPASTSQSPASAAAKDSIMDLDGVTCEPATDGSTLWNFHCDGASYPARLVNLPCPVEIHKTHDHAMYYKCTDVAQLLIVYEDEMALEEAEKTPGYTTENFPSYYHSGLTPPMKRVVERRFMAREHGAEKAPPRAEVSHVEYELQDLMERISSTKETKGRGRNRPAATSLQGAKVIEQVEDEVVDYEPWMDDYGRQPYGIEFDDQDPMCTKHPEIWLDPKEVAKITLKDAEHKEETNKKKGSAKKDGTKKKTKKKVDKDADKGPSIKKGIPAKKKMEEVDEITQAAAAMSQQLDDVDVLGAALDDEFFDFGEDGEDNIFADISF